MFSEYAESTAVGNLPTGFTQTSDDPAYDWKVVNNVSYSAPNSIYAPGGQDINSSILTAPVWTGITADYELRFQHKFAFEVGDYGENYDGAVLEISIGGGTWQEWTAVGGSFISSGYNGTIDSFVSHPLAGLGSWTGNSGGFIQTIAEFPAAAIGQSVQVLWHQGIDFIFGDDGWWIDDIQLIDTAGSGLPELSVSAVGSDLEEFNPSTTQDFVISTIANVSGNLSVAYTLSGDATAGSDFVALAGSATILSGQSSVSIPVTAITDSLIEGDETITLNLSTSPNYSIFSGSASMTIKDLPFDEYRDASFGGASYHIGEDQDFDFDGLLNLLEYAFRLDANAVSTIPFNLAVNNSGSPVLELVYYEDTRLQDVKYIVGPRLTFSLVGGRAQV